MVRVVGFAVGHGNGYGGTAEVAILVGWGGSGNGDKVAAWWCLKGKRSFVECMDG